MFEERHTTGYLNTSFSGDGAASYVDDQPHGVGRMLDRIELVLAVGVVFFSPMNFIRLPFFYFTFSDALACMCLILLLVRGRLSLRPLGPATSLVWMIGLTLLLSGLLVSSMVRGDPLRGLVYVVQYFFCYLIILLVVGGRSERQTFILAKTYVFSIFLMCLHGAYLINIVGEKNTTFVSGSGRLTGFVERENECAALIALTAPMLLLLVGTRQWPKLALLALPVMGYGVMLTGSNTGLASFALTVGLFALLTLNWRWLIPAGAFGFGLIIAIDQFGRNYLPLAFQKRVLGALENGDISEAGSFDHRLELIHEAIGRTGDTLLLGLGADQYAVSSFLQQPVHNLYLLLWTEGGLICMIGFIIMIASGLGPALAAFKRPGGKIFATCTVCTVGLFLLSVNAFPSVYGRFWSVPITLAISMSCIFLARRNYPN